VDRESFEKSVNCRCKRSFNAAFIYGTSRLPIDLRGVESFLLFIANGALYYTNISHTVSSISRVTTNPHSKPMALNDGIEFNCMHTAPSYALQPAMAFQYTAPPIPPIFSFLSTLQFSYLRYMLASA
jgi:hypothetical protein